MNSNSISFIFPMKKKQVCSISIFPYSKNKTWDIQCQIMILQPEFRISIDFHPQPLWIQPRPPDARWTYLRPKTRIRWSWHDFVTHDSKLHAPFFREITQNSPNIFVACLKTFDPSRNGSHLMRPWQKSSIKSACLCFRLGGKQRSQT